MATPNDLRLTNRRQVVLALLEAGRASRAGLSQRTGLSLPTTGKIVDDCFAAGVMRVADAAGPARLGRPGQLLKLDDVRPRFLAVQLGPVNTRLAVLTVAPPTTVGDWGCVIPTPRSLSQWTAAVARAAKPLLNGGPSTALVSLPGVLDDGSGRTLLSPNARWMEDECIAERLGKALGVPAYPIQEIQCLALGHRLTHPTADDFLLVDFGIGVGSAAMIRGELLRGPLPFTGELGHTPTPGNRAVCGCGGVGCLETLVGRRHLLGDGATDSDSLSRPEVARLTANPHPGRLRMAMKAAGLGIASAMNVLGLGRVVVTGFAANLPPSVFAVLRHAVVTATVAARFGDVQVTTARRHRLAGLTRVGIDRVIAPLE